MTKNEKDNIREWFTKADHDLKAARKLIEDCPDILDTACFHCQQAVEKYLKAYLIFNDQEISRTHNLTFLQTECTEFNGDFKALDFKNLNYFAIDIRYPDDSAEPKLSEAEYYLELAEKVKELVRSKVEIL